MAKGLVAVAFAGEEAEKIRRYARARGWSYTGLFRDCLEAYGVFDEEIIKKIEENYGVGKTRAATSE